ncbi:MAG: Gfo/Idh/MocA family oxidoreductase [Candidatus Absconditabacterales bacterium]|nr:Gfo/Idh/MocA family oxidoreductase [Candidatus Absconditabacterales bacterium]
MSTNINVAVIGVGNMGGNHVRTYSELDDVNLVAVADLNTSLAEQIAQKYGCKWYENYQDMIQQEHIDLVSIVVPTSFHYPVAEFCLQHNIHVLLEKPITPTVEEGEKLLMLAKEKNLNLLVGHIERFNPAVKKVKELLDKKDVGELTAFTFQRVGGLPPQIRDSNIVVDLAIHDIDISNYLIGQLPNRVNMHKKRNHLEGREDSVEIFMQYDGVSSYIQCNWISPIKMRKLTVTGTDGYLEMDYITQKITIFKSNYDKFRETIGTYSDYVMRFAEPDRVDISVGKKEPLKEEMLYIIDNIKKGTLIDTSFALSSLSIALQ